MSSQKWTDLQFLIFNAISLNFSIKISINVGADFKSAPIKKMARYIFKRAATWGCPYYEKAGQGFWSLPAIVFSLD